MRFLGSFSCRGTDVGVLSGRRNSVHFLSALRAFLLFFLGRFLNSGQFAQNFLALLRSLSPPCQLDRKYLLDNGVEFRPARHAQSFQLIRHARKADAQRAWRMSWKLI